MLLSSSLSILIAKKINFRSQFTITITIPNRIEYHDCFIIYFCNRSRSRSRSRKFLIWLYYRFLLFCCWRYWFLSMFYYFSHLILIILIITDIDKRGLICDEYMNGSEDFLLIYIKFSFIFMCVCVFFTINNKNN